MTMPTRLIFQWILVLVQLSMSQTSQRLCAYHFGRTPDMTETPLRSMTNNGIWKPMMTPVLPRINFIAWTINVESYSLCHCDTRLVRDLVIGIIIPSSISLPTSATLLVPLIFHPRDLVTCCNFGCNLTEWAQSLYPSRGMDKSRSWSIRLNVSLWNT